MSSLKIVVGAGGVRENIGLDGSMFGHCRVVGAGPKRSEGDLLTA